MGHEWTHYHIYFSKDAHKTTCGILIDMINYEGKGKIHWNVKWDNACLPCDNISWNYILRVSCMFVFHLQFQYILVMF